MGRGAGEQRRAPPGQPALLRRRKTGARPGCRRAGERLPGELPPPGGSAASSAWEPPLPRREAAPAPADTSRVAAVTRSEGGRPAPAAAVAGGGCRWAGAPGGHGRLRPPGSLPVRVRRSCGMTLMHVMAGLTRLVSVRTWLLGNYFSVEDGGFKGGTLSKTCFIIKIVWMIVDCRKLIRFDTFSVQPKKLAALCGGLASRAVREVPQLSASFPRGLRARGAPHRALRFASYCCSKRV